MTIHLNPAKYSESSIIERMKSIATKMSQSCDDPILGNTHVVFKYETELDDVVAFTHDDCYLFLRAALGHRRNTAEYKTKKAKIEELTKIVEVSRTPREKRKDAKAELKSLQDSL